MESYDEKLYSGDSLGVLGLGNTIRKEMLRKWRLKALDILGGAKFMGNYDGRG